MTVKATKTSADRSKPEAIRLDRQYPRLVSSISALMQQARGVAARSINSLATATYWLVGHQIVEFEQRGKRRAGYGEALLESLSLDLSARLGKGFSRQNIQNMRAFYLAFDRLPNCQTPSGVSLASICQTPSGKLAKAAAKGSARVLPVPAEPTELALLATQFPLPWSAYVRLLAVKNPQARAFYAEEALRNGWTIRQLHRQIETQFYERSALSKQKRALLEQAATPQPGEVIPAEQMLKEPFLLEFLNLKDEYSESDLEEALIYNLENFLLELGGQFAFIGRQRRLRIGDEWYRLDLLFFHRRLRCLVLIDLKLGRFTHADAGQMHLYCNYAREHWTGPDENPPVGLILCAQKDAAVAHYALDGLPNKIMAAEYRTALPGEAELVAQIRKAQQLLARRT